jgi:hypothetical protein
MNEFKTILTKLKDIIKQKVQTDKKVMDKQVAEALGIKPATFASYKSRDKLPYQAILTYCHDNRLNVRKILFNEDQPVIDYPTQAPIEDGKVRVRYFKTLAAYARYLKYNF